MAEEQVGEVGGVVEGVAKMRVAEGAEAPAAPPAAPAVGPSDRAKTQLALLQALPPAAQLAVLQALPPAAPAVEPSDGAKTQLALLQALLAGKKAKPASGEQHKFWDTQPVPKEKEAEVSVGPLDDAKTVADVRAEPYALPGGFEWCTLDVADDAQLKEAYTLLTENYVEDDDGMFRFDYSPEFLRWALMPPGFFKEWTVGVRQSSNQRLLAMITGIPVHVVVLDCKMAMAEINFLCVHTKLRSKRLAPVLIKEVTRRVNLTGQWQAIYTAGVRIPKPIGVAQYWHRSLNPKKLIAVGFSRLPPRMTMPGVIRLYKTLEQPANPGIVAMERKHVPGVTKLLHAYLQAHKVWIEMDEAEVAHWLLPRPDVVYAYCVINQQGEVTDFCSFYNLPSSVLGHKDYKLIKAAYSFYNVATTCSLQQLINDALHFAARADFDVFNALDIMQNKDFLKELKFGEGDGRLHYYLYNYAVPELQPKDIGVVLL